MDISQIDDKEINVEEIMRKIRNNIKKSKEAPGEMDMNLCPISPWVRMDAMTSS